MVIAPVVHLPLASTSRQGVRGLTAAWFACVVALSSASQVGAGPPAAVTRIVAVPGATIHVRTIGHGVSVVLLPSLGRGVEDFDDLARRLAEAGFQVVLPQPRGIGRSTGTLEGLTLHDLARDVTAVIETLRLGRVAIVGHAFGNRLARVIAADRAELVSRLVLLAAGGKVPMDDETRVALTRSFDLRLARSERLAFVRTAFFAGDTVPASWETGWYPSVAEAQQQASQRTPTEQWWGAGGVAPILVVQGTHDRVARPENARVLKAEFSSRVTVIDVDAGHAMLPEQPERIAAAVVGWLKPQ